VCSGEAARVASRALARAGRARFNGGLHNEGLAMLMEAAASTAPGWRPNTSACLTCPTAIAGVLLRDGGLAPAEMGRFLCGAGAALLQPALAALVRSFDLAFRPLDEALRALLGVVELPAECGEPHHGWPTSPTLGARHAPAATSSPVSTDETVDLGAGSSGEAGSTLCDSLSLGCDAEGASGGGFFEASGGASKDSVTRASSAVNGEPYDGARVAVRLLAEHFFACNQASVGSAHGWPSVDVLFAVAMQLIATSRHVIAYSASVAGVVRRSPSKSGSPSSKEVNAALQVRLEREWASFHSSCQDASFALSGRRLPEERLKTLYRRVAERPFARSGLVDNAWSEGLAFDDFDHPSSSGGGDGGNGGSGIAESGDSFSGYLWLLASPSAGYPSGSGADRVPKRSETPAGVFSPPWLGRRLWVVLRGWVLYLFSEAPFPERGELIAVVPLGDTLPQLRHVCVELSGHLKVAQGAGACPASPSSAASSASTSVSPGGFLKRLLLSLQGGVGKGGVGGSGVLELRDLVIRAQSEEDAGRWYLALTKARSTPQADAEAEFAQQVSTKAAAAAKRQFWRVPVKRGARRDDRGGSEEAQIEGEASAKSGRRFASPTSRSIDEQPTLPPKATLIVSMSGILHVNLRVRVAAQDQPRRARALESKVSFERRLCTLIGRRLFLAAETLSPKSDGSSGGMTDRAFNLGMTDRVVNLADLGIVVPSTDRSRPELGAFRFELVSADQRSIAICAAPSLKEYAQWFKALSSLAPSAQQRIYLDDPNASPRSFGSDSRYEHRYEGSAPLGHATNDGSSSSDEDAATADGSHLDEDAPRSRMVQADQQHEAAPVSSHYRPEKAPEQVREHAPPPSPPLNLPAVTAARDLLARLAMLGLEEPATLSAAPMGAEPRGASPSSRATVSIAQESAAPRSERPSAVTLTPSPRPPILNAARAAALFGSVQAETATGRRPLPLQPSPPRPPPPEQHIRAHEQRQQVQLLFPQDSTTSASPISSYLLPAFLPSSTAPVKASEGAPPRPPPLDVDELLPASPHAHAAWASYFRALEEGKERQDFFGSRPIPLQQAPGQVDLRLPASVYAPDIGSQPSTPPPPLALPPPPAPPPQRRCVSEQEYLELRPRQEPQRGHGGPVATLLQRPRMFRVEEPFQRGEMKQEQPQRQQEPCRRQAAKEADDEVFEDAHQPAAHLREATPPAVAPSSLQPVPAAVVAPSSSARKPRRAPPPEPILEELSPPPPPPFAARRGASGSSSV
jgi:hypothetical protein